MYSPPYPLSPPTGGKRGLIDNLYQGNLIRYNYFIADFYCKAKKVVIKLDGLIHNTSKEYDQFRDSELQKLGIHILRIRNEALVNMKEVLHKITLFLDQISS